VDQTAVGEWTQALRHPRGLRKGREGGWIIAASLLDYAELAELLRRVQLIPERPVDRERLAQVVVCLGVVALLQSDAAEITEEQRGLPGVARAPARSQPLLEGTACLREVGPGPGDEAEAVVLAPYGHRVPDPLEDLLGAGERFLGALQVLGAGDGLAWVPVFPPSPVDAAQIVRVLPQRPSVTDPLGKVLRPRQVHLGAIVFVGAMQRLADRVQRDGDPGGVGQSLVAP